MLKCKICGKDAVNEDYCAHHKKAYRNLIEQFETWKKALGISWKDYLNEIVKNRFTGTKVKEVAEPLLSKEQ